MFYYLLHCLVSILVLVDLAFEYYGVEHFYEISLVSILVLVDLAFEYKLVSVDICRNWSFNPCFSGSCFRILLFLIGCRVAGCFNPCFSGSCFRIQIQREPYKLFYTSFNPCFSGSCFRICCDYFRTSYSIHSFQSLF